MIVDDQRNIRRSRDRQNFFSHAANFVARKIFRAQLNDVRTAVAKLPRNFRRRTTPQICRVNESVERAVAKTFHEWNLQKKTEQAKDICKNFRKQFQGEAFSPPFCRIPFAEK